MKMLGGWGDDEVGVFQLFLGGCKLRKKNNKMFENVGLWLQVVCWRQSKRCNKDEGGSIVCVRCCCFGGCRQQLFQLEPGGLCCGLC